MVLYGKIFDEKEILSETILKKDFSMDNSLLKDMEELSSKVTSQKKKYIDNDIYLLKVGLNGEKNVYYELKNSFLPIYCIHDIRLEYKDYIAQLDFVVITNKFIYVLETKKLIGDIEINFHGEFTRIIKDRTGKLKRKEGMVSPISQNEKHINILKAILKEFNVTNPNIPIKSLVVIANPKTVVNKKYAKKEIKEAICKYDNLASIIKEEMEKDGPVNLRLNDMNKIADFLINKNTIRKFNLTGKYRITEEDMIPNRKEAIEKVEEMIIEKEGNEKNCETLEESLLNIKVNDEDNLEKTDRELKLEKQLKDYRYAKSKELGIKPYFILNNNGLENLVKMKPSSIEELKNVSGFGEKNIEKYGDDILKSINSI